MKRLLVGSVVVALFLTSFLFYMAFAQEATISVTAHNAVVLFLSGEVKVKQVALGEWVEAVEGMALFPGDTVKTGAGSWVEIGVGSSRANVMRVNESTLIDLTDLAPVKINILDGELRALVDDLGAGETFEVRTPMSVCGVRGTGWDTNTDGKKVVTDVYEGDVFFAAVDEEGRPIEDPVINAGKRGILKDPRKPIEIKNVPADKMRDWTAWKEGFIERRGAGSVQQKAKGLQQKQKATQNLDKGKQGVFENADNLSMENRVSEPDSPGSP